MRAILLCLLLLGATGCADSKEIGGVTYEPYGIMNEHIIKDDCIVYQVTFETVIGFVIFIETIIVPIYVVGYNMWEPVKKKSNCQ